MPILAILVKARDTLDKMLVHLRATRTYTYIHQWTMEILQFHFHFWTVEGTQKIQTETMHKETNVQNYKGGQRKSIHLLTFCRIEYYSFSVLILSLVNVLGVAWLTTKFTYSLATISAHVLLIFWAMRRIVNWTVSTLFLFHVPEAAVVISRSFQSEIVLYDFNYRYFVSYH